MLIFDPNPPTLRWCVDTGRGRLERHCLFSADWAQQVAQTIDDPSGLKWIGYVLHNGGDVVTSPVSALGPGSLADVMRTERLLPDHNGITCRVAEHWMGKYPALPHVLLCDTAFFTTLPPEAGLYAIPYELSKEGIRRYGGYGLCHQWAWEQVRRLTSAHAGRVVSVYLGDHTNLTAMRDGLAVETTIGFSPVEGIISASACGDIDPTVIFQMQSTGMSLDQIRSILTSRSGITGLLGRPAGMLDVLMAERDPRMRLAKAVLQYAILKAIGAFAAVLGGLDTLVFVTPHARQCRGFVTEVCQGLACVGIRLRTGPVAQEASVELTDATSLAKAFCLGYNRWEVLEEHADAFLKEKGNGK